MVTSFTLTYKEIIESLSEEPDFEEKGDALFMQHEDDEARLEWAFYRPSGSHPDQVSDKNVMVSVMAFNHSRLGSYERFTRLHPDVIASDHLRIKIRNRSRMLFRAMVDSDFKELVAVLEYAPVFMDLACDQVINGRIWNDSYADLDAASAFCSMAGAQLDDRLKEGVRRRLQPLKALSFEEAKSYLAQMASLAHNLHPFIRKHYAWAFAKWVERQQLHPLQRIALEKMMKEL